MSKEVSVEVLSVLPAEGGDDLLGGRIRALPDTDQGLLAIQGWVLGRTSRATAVELMDGEDVIGRADVKLKRPDVAEKFPGVDGAAKSGFRLTLKPDGKGESELLARAILEDGRAVPIESVRVRVVRRGGLRRLAS